MGTLGQGVNTASIYARGGKQRIMPLSNLGGLEWDRRRDGISESAVYAQVAGQSQKCCDLLGNLHTWGHELVIERDGARVWEGPITRLAYTRDGVRIGAKDVLGWLLRSPTSASVVSAARVVDVAAAYCASGYAAGDAAGNNILPYLQVLGTGTGPTVSREVMVWAGYWADELADLVKNGLHFTTVGRRLVLWPDTTQVSRTATLLPDIHMTGEVEVVEDGMDLSVITDILNDSGETATSGTTDPFYGPVTQRIAGGLVTGSTYLTNMAATHRDEHFPAPEFVNIPAGSVLSCDAPFDISELVPGAVVPVETESLCRPVHGTQSLLQVKVTDAGKGEQVAITLGPTQGGLVA